MASDDPKVLEKRHARRVASIAEGHRQWVRSKSDTFGLANAIFNTEFWEWYDAWGKQKFGGKWRLKRRGEETEDNRLVREVQSYNAALFPNNMKVNVKPDPQGRGDPAVKSALASLWVSESDQKMGILSGSETAILHAGSAFKVAVEEGTGTPLERVYMEVIPPWELVADRDARTYRGARFIGHMYQTPETDVADRYKAQLDKLGVRLHGGAKIDVLHGEPGAMTPTMNPQATSEGEGLDYSDDRYVTVLELCNFRESIVGPNGEVYRGRLEIWILDQGGALSEKPIATTVLPFSDPDGGMSPHIFPLAYMHEPPYPYRAKAPVARLLPLNVALNRMNFQMMQDVQRNTRKGIARRGAFGQDEIDNLFDGQDKNVAYTEDERAFEQLFYNIPHQPIAADTVAFRAAMDNALTRQQGPSQAAIGNITGATAYEIQTNQLYTEAGFKLHASILEVTLTRVLACVLRAFIVAGVDASDSVGGELAADQSLAPVGTIQPNADAATDGPTVTAEMTQADTRKPGGWRSYTIEYNGETYEVTREALDGACDVVFTQSERTPVTDQAVSAFLTGPAMQQYTQWVQQAIKGDPFAEAVADEIASRAGLPKSVTVGEVRRRLAEQKATPPPPGDAKEAESPPPGAPEAPSAPPPQAEGPEGMALSMLQEAFDALGAVANADPTASAALQGAGGHLKQAISALQAGDMEAAKEAVLGASEALSAVEMRDPRVDAARKAVAAVVKAIASDTLPASREMPTGLGEPEPEEMA